MTKRVQLPLQRLGLPSYAAVQAHLKVLPWDELMYFHNGIPGIDIWGEPKDFRLGKGISPNKKVAKQQRRIEKLINAEISARRKKANVWQVHASQVPVG